MAEQMTNLIGEPPTGIVYPVWRWYRLRGKHKKPDLRSERWCYGSGGEEYTCIEKIGPDANCVTAPGLIFWSIQLYD